MDPLLISRSRNNASSAHRARLRGSGCVDYYFRDTRRPERAYIHMRVYWRLWARERLRGRRTTAEQRAASIIKIPVYAAVVVLFTPREHAVMGGRGVAALALCGCAGANSGPRAVANDARARAVSPVYISCSRCAMKINHFSYAVPG